MKKEILRNRKGFTLIELIVVIVIIGILGGIAVPRFINMQQNAKIDADRATARTIISVTKLYITEKDLTDLSVIDMGDLVAAGHFAAAPVAQTTKNTMVVAVTGTALVPIVTVGDTTAGNVIYDSSKPAAPFGASAAYTKADGS